MTVLNKELKKGTKGFVVWTVAIASMLLVCIFLYPDMKTQMDGLNELFANMGSFTKAFGMDQLNFGTLIGFYGVECCNVLGLGGGLFAAFLGITIVSKEEKDHTAEFLFSHPVSRTSVLLQKLAAVVLQILVLNLVIALCSVAGIVIIGEELPTEELLLLHSAYLALQVEIGLICVGLSTFLRRGSIGIGLGSAAILYFMNIILNTGEKVEFLKYITPYAYAEPSTIIEEMALDPVLISIGLGYGVVLSTVGIIWYSRRDLAA